ncbi:hypothetical protein CBR_g591 [Chara braunii]|uniref:Uncharacterized protein n=1 Tax=Chara braunii TaxID=69332 RepID=A0A388KBS3_CHABU|nr:hypothetical protein CBR_g591 [Chara braunii]|eukprot:GBG67456.1 hypothetical protein CBR_g591 [Chara braunii]
MGVPSGYSNLRPLLLLPFLSLLILPVTMIVLPFAYQYLRATACFSSLASFIRNFRAEEDAATASAAALLAAVANAAEGPVAIGASAAAAVPAAGIAATAADPAVIVTARAAAVGIRIPISRSFADGSFFPSNGYTAILNHILPVVWVTDSPG